MTERSRRFLYRLYGLAGCTYFYITRELHELEEKNKHSKERLEVIEREKERLERLYGKSIVVREEPEDNDGDQWTMFKKDYDVIREIMKVYDDNTDWVTIDVSKESPLYTLVEVADENT